MSMEELANVKGRGWDDVDVSKFNLVSFATHHACSLNHSIEQPQHVRKYSNSCDTRVI
jgi:hypothetical protein